MQIAFYAPMKHPESPVPSGDREMARNLIRALSRHHRVEVASRFCSRDGTGDPVRQQRIVSLGAWLSKRLVRRWRAGPAASRPDAWFTYHVYHKAPDAACVMQLLSDPSCYHRLAPFTDTAPFAAAAERRADNKQALCARFGLMPETPLLLAVGMMRDGDKLASYRVLADALGRISDREWTLLIVGDGPARAETEKAFAELDSGLAPGRVIYAGAAAPEELPAFYAAADLMVWPAVNEAYGMAMLEAPSQAFLQIRIVWG